MNRTGRTDEIARTPLDISVALRVRAEIRLWVADLPEAVLADDGAVLRERPQVAAADVDPLACGRRPADGPLGGSATAAREVIVVPVVDVWDALEPGGESAPDLVLAHEPGPPPVRTSRDSKTQSSANLDMIASRS